MSLLGLLAGPIEGLLDKVIPDVNERRQKAEEMEAALVAISDKQQSQQNEINLQQAKHDSIFIAGPRPFAMWVCGASLAYSFILQPILQDILTFIYKEAAPTLTTLDQATLMPVTMGLLGLGGYRTYEKYKGVSRETLRLKRGIFSRFRKGGRDE